MTDNHLPVREPANLRFLRRLVTVLTAVMIIGVSTIVILLVTKLGQTPARPVPPTLPAALQLPAGTEASAVTFGTGWIAVIDRGERVLVYSDDGTLVGTTDLLAPDP